MVRVSGTLVPESFHREADSTLAQFTLTDGTQTLAAIHDGVVLRQSSCNDQRDGVRATSTRR